MSLDSPCLCFEEVRQKALELGFDDVGATRAEISDDHILAYRDWLSKGYQAGMGYMENTLRCRPQELLPGAKYAVLFVSYYKQARESFQSGKGVIASYARGRDYHQLHHRRLRKLISWIEEKIGKRGVAKGFSDSTPILEKALAVQAGLGWFGKNTLVIHRKFGTFFLLAGLLLTCEIDQAVCVAKSARCGSCRRCLDACPAGALVSPYLLDSNRCLSYQLIENRGEIPPTVASQNPGYAFGCDICQDVCPHNVRTPLSTQKAFLPESGMGSYLTVDRVNATLDAPETYYGTPLKRQGPQGLLRNLQSLNPSSGEPLCP